MKADPINLRKADAATARPGDIAQPKAQAEAALTRQRILDAALELFSHGGYDKVSVRDIALAAQVNVASISYYFGGKPGLYRAALTEPLGSARGDIPLFDQPHFSLREALEGLYRSLLEPHIADPRAQQCVRLHLREMLDPTGAWTEQVQNDFRPAHEALVRVLQRHLQLPRVDDDLLYLSMAIAGLAVHLHLSRDVAEALRPGLLADETAVRRWGARLVEQATALVQAEAVRRGATLLP
jgi:AcrR family transcriptional regulator